MSSERHKAMASHGRIKSVPPSTDLCAIYIQAQSSTRRCIWRRVVDTLASRRSCSCRMLSGSGLRSCQLYMHMIDVLILGDHHSLLAMLASQSAAVLHADEWISRVCNRIMAHRHMRRHNNAVTCECAGSCLGACTQLYAQSNLQEGATQRCAACRERRGRQEDEKEARHSACTNLPVSHSH
jgi:hypothetical protein